MNKYFYSGYDFSNEGGNMRTFLLKAKHFFKRNIYPITVSVCTVLVLGIVTVSAYSSIKNSGNEAVVETSQNGIQNDAEKDKDEASNTGQTGTEEKEEAKPTVSSDPIIFGLPFEGAAISKEYTDSSLLYDATTKLWCTHQALDFACESGKKIVAVYGGKIEKIENSMMNGTVIHLKVSDELTVVYKGLSSNVSVKEGDKVTKGQVLGVVSSFLAEKADGLHLHLELIKAGKLVNPLDYFSFNK